MEPTKDIIGQKIEKVRQFLIPRAYPDVYTDFDDIAQALQIAVKALEKIIETDPDDVLAAEALSRIRSLPPQ